MCKRGTSETVASREKRRRRPAGGVESAAVAAWVAAVRVAGPGGRAARAAARLGRTLGVQRSCGFAFGAARGGAQSLLCGP